MVIFYNTTINVGFSLDNRLMNAIFFERSFLRL
jgi:hypothetical protein